MALRWVQGEYRGTESRTASPSSGTAEAPSTPLPDTQLNNVGHFPPAHPVQRPARTRYRWTPMMTQSRGPLSDAVCQYQEAGGLPVEEHNALNPGESVHHRGSSLLLHRPRVVLHDGITCRA